MKKAIMAGALAVTFFGGVAFAEESQLSVEQDITTEQQELSPAESELGDDQLDTDTSTETDVYGGSGTEGQTKAETEVDVTTPAYASPVVVDEDEKNKESDADMRGLTVLLGGGVEGYSGTLAPQINPGLGWGVTAAIKPTKVLGLEFGYSGAMNSFQGGDATDADLVRQGGQVAATIGLGAAPVQPYILGGLGLHHYDVRSGGASLRDDTNAAIPLGAGLRTHIGNFTADLRGSYNIMFNQDFAPGAQEMDLIGLEATRGGRYSGLLQVGTTF